MIVLYGYQNRQRLLLYTSLTDWFLEPWWKEFTARYGLIPYIEQIAFRLLKVKCQQCNTVRTRFSMLVSTSATRHVRRRGWYAIGAQSCLCVLF